MSARISGMLDPMVEHQLVLRDKLGSFEKAIAFGHALDLAVRGLLVGLAIDILLLLARWIGLPLGPLQPTIPLLLGVPFTAAVAGAAAALARSRSLQWVARRLDHRLGLAERTVTALSAPREQVAAGPLHLWQVRDALQHLERVDALEVFPLPFPRRQLLVAVLLAALTTAVYNIPSPFPAPGQNLDARSQVVRDAAERLTQAEQSLAEDPTMQSRDLAQVREMLRESARQLEANLGSPEQAAQSLEEIERELQAMADADEELAMALATVASALAASPETRDLGVALQSGDFKEVSRAARDLARQAEGMSGNAQARAGRALRAAADRAGASPAALEQQLRQAADALDPSGSGSESTQGLSQQDALAEAQSALRELAEASAAAAARQRALEAMQGASNDLSRAQGAGRQSSAGNPNEGMGGNPDQRGMPGGQQGGGEGEPSGEEGDFPGSGFGTGTMNQSGEGSRLDAITRPEQVGSEGAAPDEMGDAPLLFAPGENEGSVEDLAVQPQFGSQEATAPGQDASIPLGLRELVKEYFTTQEAQP